MWRHTGRRSGSRNLGGKQESYLPPPLGVIEVQVSEVTSVWFNGTMGCHLQEKVKCSNGIHDGQSWHRVCINISRERQKICRVVAIKITGKVLCSGEIGCLCCPWKACHQNLDMIDEMKHIPGTWIWKPFTIFVRRRPEIEISRCCSKSILMEVSDIIIYIMKILGVLVLEFL